MEAILLGGCGVEQINTGVAGLAKQFLNSMVYLRMHNTKRESPHVKEHGAKDNDAGPKAPEKRKNDDGTKGLDRILSFHMVCKRMYCESKADSEPVLKLRILRRKRKEQNAQEVSGEKEDKEKENASEDETKSFGRVLPHDTTEPERPRRKRLGRPGPQQ
jgi:hypothetical protein